MTAVLWPLIRFKLACLMKEPAGGLKWYNKMKYLDFKVLAKKKRKRKKMSAGDKLDSFCT